MKIRLNGLVCMVEDLINNMEHSIEAFDGNFNTNFKSNIIDSIYDRIGSCPDVLDGENIADYLQVDISDDKVYNVLYKIYENLSDGSYEWEDVKVVLEDDKYLECYFYVDVNIDEIVKEI